MKKILSVVLTIVMIISLFTIAPNSVSSASYEYAMYPGDVLQMTQGAYGEYNTYSHNGQTGYYQNAFDMVGNAVYKAPFTGTIIKIGTSLNVVAIASENKVYWADGTLDYLTVYFMHDNNISDITDGARITQGTSFYHPGTAGGATGSHLHIYARRGRLTAKNMYSGSGDVYVNKALYIKNTTSVVQTGGYSWKTVTPSRVTFDTSSLSGVTDNNAIVTTWVSNNGTISETGVYIGTNTMEKIKINSPNAQWTRFELKYNLNDIYGILTPGQKYNYQFYVISNGEEFKSSVATFTTKGNAYISFDTYGLESINETVAKPSVWFSNNNGLNISEIGFCYGTNRKDLDSKKIIGGVYWTRSHLKYELSGLIPNVNYYVRYYIIVNGVTYYSDFINFKTKSKITFDTYSINGTKPKTVKCGVWFSNKEGYTLNEIGFFIGKDESSLEKVKIKENVGWTRSHLLYTLSDYYTSIKFDTNYSLKYYIVIDDTVYYSDFINFRTERDVSFDTYAQGKITSDSFPVSVWMSNEDGNNLDSIGFMYGKSQNELIKVEVTQNVRWTRSDLSYDIKKYVSELTSGIYYYCFYVKVGNNTYLSNINNATYSAPTENTTHETIEPTQPTVTKPTVTETVDTTPTVPTTAPITKKPVENKTTLTLSRYSGSIYVKGTATIKPTVKNGKGVTTYKSSNTRVAKVDSRGKVTALKAGTARITITNNKVSKVFTVKVLNPRLNKTSVSISRGKSYTLKITGKIGTAKFYTSNKKIATVNSKGKITVNKKSKRGSTATITVRTNGITLKCKVKVK
ncbi:MAG: Ig-like domain-containing protein [Ruminococcus sp.]